MKYVSINRFSRKTQVANATMWTAITTCVPEYSWMTSVAMPGYCICFLLTT